MKPKKRYPLADLLAADAKQKKILDQQFGAFYERAKKELPNTQFKELMDMLEVVQESVRLVAWGRRIGSPIVTIEADVEEPEGWND
jgi:hypothetical protein